MTAVDAYPRTGRLDVEPMAQPAFSPSNVFMCALVDSMALRHRNLDGHREDTQGGRRYHPRAREPGQGPSDHSPAPPGR